ncbi:MAG: ABC transporter ATP-binding protein [Armatimonadota bacterium]
MQPILELHDIHVGYAAREGVLRDVSLTVGEGDFVAVIGPNGSGKTTLLRTIAGVLRPSWGDVRIAGRSLRQWSRQMLAREMAVVPQMTWPPFAFTVRDYVSLGRNPYLPPWASPRRQDREAVHRALTLTGLQDLADKPVTELSGGEFQRSLLARALAQQPSLLLLDEPTAFLDPAYAVSMLGLIEELNAQGLTVVAVLHDLNLAATYSRRVVALRDGQVFADGEVEQVMRGRVLEDLYSTPVLVDQGPLGRPRITLLKARRNHEV